MATSLDEVFVSVGRDPNAFRVRRSRKAELVGKLGRIEEIGAIVLVEHLVRPAHIRIK